MAFKVFLSHRYKSVIVNLYFFEVFSLHEEVQFEIDEGSTLTCVTKLERMIRSSDAFIGIYPFSKDISQIPMQDDLLHASRYFRLECDLAIRSRIPALILYDKRYRDIFKFPRHILCQKFDFQEVTGKGESPNRQRFELLFDSFQKKVTASKEFKSISDISSFTTTVGVIVPHSISSAYAYTDDELNEINRLLSVKGFNTIKIFSWPLSFDGEQLSILEDLDFAIVEIGSEVMATGIVGFLHGRFIPCIRLLKGYEDRNILSQNSNIRGLYGSVPVGYAKDIVIWKTIQDLTSELELRLKLIQSPVKRIGTRDEAIAYFRKAELRKDSIFLSYSGEDSEIASVLSRELKKHFQSVFNYRDGESITPGKEWIQEIFDKLSGAKLAIPLISSSYFASGNCRHEAQEIIARCDSDKMFVIPIKIYEEDLKQPTWMSNKQYMRYYEYDNVQSLVNIIIESFDKLIRKANNPLGS